MRGSIAIVIAIVVNSRTVDWLNSVAHAKMKASSLKEFVRNNRANAPLHRHVWFTTCLIYRRRNSMTKFKTLGAICLAISLAAASPALARAGHGGAGFHGGGFHGGGAHFAGGGFRGGGFHGGRGGIGVGPGIAAGLVAGAVIGGGYGYYGGPGYYDNSYAYDNGYNGGYAARNGFVCQPGTWFRGEDGRPHLCQ
jgi:hypothetical protein